MNPEGYTQSAFKAAERYQSLLTTFRFMLMGSLSDPFSAKRADELRAAAVDVGRTYYRTERTIIEQEVRASAQNALQTAQRDLGVRVADDIPDALSAFLEQHIAYLDGEVRTQLSRDVEMLVRRYREFAIEAQLTANAVGFNMTAPVQVGAQDKARFYFRDRQGRLYPSQKFIRSVWRHTLLTVGAEFYLLEAASRGVQQAEVVHPEPNHQFNGTVIELSNLGGGQTFIDVRDEIFHPQSNATLRAIV